MIAGAAARHPLVLGELRTAGGGRRILPIPLGSLIQASRSAAAAPHTTSTVADTEHPKLRVVLGGDGYRQHPRGHRQASGPFRFGRRTRATPSGLRETTVHHFRQRGGVEAVVRIGCEASEHLLGEPLVPLHLVLK